jgi:hypothetical protein
LAGFVVHLEAEAIRQERPKVRHQRPGAAQRRRLDPGIDVEPLGINPGRRSQELHVVDTVGAQNQGPKRGSVTVSWPLGVGMIAPFAAVGFGRIEMTSNAGCV